MDLKQERRGKSTIERFQKDFEEMENPKISEYVNTFECWMPYIYPSVEAFSANHNIKLSAHPLAHTTERLFRCPFL